MPQLVDSLAAEVRWLMGADPDWEDGPDMLHALDTSSLWWVAEPMAKLALAASYELPGWDWAAARPSPSGIILWEGSTGQALTHAGDRALARHVPIQGIRWFPDGPTTGFQALVAAEDAPWGTPSDSLAMAPLTWQILDQGNLVTKPRLAAQANAIERLHALLGTTLLLSAQPTIATRRPHHGGERMLARQGPHLPVAVTQVVLRESVRDAVDAQSDREAEAKWHLKSRFLVRGHWRQQPVGPGRQLRRPTYIAPYLKGPADAPLNLTKEVHVWRR